MVYSRDQMQLPQVPLSLYETGNGRIWVIGRIGYVYSVDIGSGEWMTYAGLHFQCETADGLQWFFSRSNQIAVSHDPRTGTWLQYGLKDGLIDRPKVIISSSHGLVWAAGSHGNRAAISVFDGKRWVRICHPEFAQTIEPNSVFEASGGTVWFGAGGQLLTGSPHAGGALQYKVETNETVRLLRHHAPPDFPYFITSMIETPDKSLWVGSTLLFRSDGTSQLHSIPDLPKGNTVDMVMDHQQTLWVAKENYGVCRQQGDLWRMFSTKDGLAGLLLSHLLVLRDGSILASSGSGISRFDGSTWTTYAYPEWFAMSKRESGLRQSDDGSIWLNYAEREMRTAQMVVNGTASFCTIRHRPETNPPETRITDCPKQVAQPGNSTVAWSGHDLWSSTPLGELQYSWRLDGGEWSAFSRETGRTFLNLESGRHELEVRARDRAFNIDPTPARVEFTVIPPVWRQPWFVALISVLTGSIVLLAWILIRTRERHLKERQAERERHLVEVDRLKTGFFTNISHELRTPLTVILGPLEMMLKTESDPEKKSVLAMMVKNARRVADLITQLLDLRKIEEGKVQINAVWGDLVPLVRDWTDSLQPLADSAGISCLLESVAECRGWFDEDKVHKIFTNLIANAIKYTAAGGEVRVRLSVEVDDCRAKTVEDLSAARLEGQEPFQPYKRRIKFVVEDTGAGISQEHLGHIFERFYRVSESSAAAGSGIGLNLTKELVDLLGGEIHVESPVHPDPERPGTRFTVSLPLGQRSEVRGQRSEVGGQKSEVGEQRSEVGGRKAESVEDFRPLNPLCPSGEEAPLILVVEDDEDIRNFITDGLGPDYRIETADNGAAGLQIAVEQVPDLIITDLMMPVMDGITLCRELK
ncbi:MAG: ATP-binding protein, partial [Pontiellaceae bacterium]|nr:ATP-binding protein [Pontiellaceae bacterium]